MTAFRCPPSERLEEALTGLLSPKEAASLEAHLADCSRCREAMAGQAAIDRTLRSLPLPEAPPLVPPVMARIRAMEPRARWTERFLSPILALLLVIAAALSPPFPLAELLRIVVAACKVATTIVAPLIAPLGGITRAGGILFSASLPLLAPLILAEAGLAILVLSGAALTRYRTKEVT